jgi:hypothetical protein
MFVPIGGLGFKSAVPWSRRGLEDSTLGLPCYKSSKVDGNSLPRFLETPVGAQEPQDLDQILAKRREKLRRNLAAMMFFVAF